VTAKVTATVVSAGLAAGTRDGSLNTFVEPVQRVAAAVLVSVCVDA
jgi:hypothetical protein